MISARPALSSEILSIDADDGGSVSVELETQPNGERVTHRLPRASVDLLIDALPLLRDGKIRHIEADDLGNEDKDA